MPEQLQRERNRADLELDSRNGGIRAFFASRKDGGRRMEALAEFREPAGDASQPATAPRDALVDRHVRLTMTRQRRRFGDARCNTEGAGSSRITRLAALGNSIATKSARGKR